MHGLGEFAYRNGLDLRGLRVVGPRRRHGVRPRDYDPVPGRPLIPFGGGIDSIVTVGALAADHPDAALCVVHPPGDRFAAIEDAAAVTGLPVARIAREIDPLVRRSDELGFLNGHVPVTAVITAAAVVAAVLERRDAVVLSNEWSASVPTLVRRWPSPSTTSGPRARSSSAASAELVRADPRAAASRSSPTCARGPSCGWPSEFARLTEYHGVFRSCNRAFHQDPAQRLDHWCGRATSAASSTSSSRPSCSAASSAPSSAGTSPWRTRQRGALPTLLGLGADAKPFECVGDVDECRAAALLDGASGADRAGTASCSGRCASAVRRRRRPQRRCDHGGAARAARGPHHIPDRYAPADLLVRAR